VQIVTGHHCGENRLRYRECHVFECCHGGATDIDYCISIACIWHVGEQHFCRGLRNSDSGLWCRRLGQPILVTIMKVVFGLVSQKATMIWFSSRILRKVRVGESEWNSLLKQDDTFVQNYVRVSKGRHRTVGIIYGLCYFWCSIVLDFNSSNLLPVRLVPSVAGALIAFRVSVSCASLAMFGAYPIVASRRNW
jgi:hypothetical protein